MSDEEPTLTFEEPMQQFRVLFSDGGTVTVRAARDDSVMRAWVLDQYFGAGKRGAEQRIEGVARLDPQGTLL